MSLSPEKMKEILAKVKGKPEVAAEPETDYKGAARKAAAKRLFGAIEAKNEDDFLSALGDLSTIDEE